jgi:hypothetical protein
LVDWVDMVQKHRGGEIQRSEKSKMHHCQPHSWTFDHHLFLANSPVVPRTRVHPRIAAPRRVRQLGLGRAQAGLDQDLPKLLQRMFLFGSQVTGVSGQGVEGLLDLLLGARELGRG